ncbi:MAG: PIN domain-containing protein [Chloroflexi bacterium]|nr:PIN domain-containing protein [Chloroflexota bacterium]
MTFDEIPAGSRLFIDANTFIYHFTGQSAECRRLLERCRAGNVRGATGTHVLSEVTHQLMRSEATHKRLITPGGNVTRKLKENPQIVSALETYQQQVALIPAMGIEVLPVDVELILASASVRRRYGLLTMDSITVAMMERHGISALATLDHDFQRIEWLQVYAPELDSRT